MQHLVRRLEFDDCARARDLFGPQNAHLSLIAEHTGTDLDSRGSAVTITATSQKTLQTVGKLLNELYGVLGSGKPVGEQEVLDGLRLLAQDEGVCIQSVHTAERISVTPKRDIVCRTATQRDYIEAIRTRELVFGVGPAGTGKTYLAVAMAVMMLSTKRVRRLVLTRPAVEAGEKLGFLPGDMAEKVNPYLRPLLDALADMLDAARVQEWIETGVIEIAPLAFMRGRTLNNAFIILDEAQNTTPEQMKMFLTRLGQDSRAVITGDTTQIDLPRGQLSGLVQSLGILSGVEGVGLTRFEKTDVVRHPLVARIVEAYERHEQEANSSG